MLVGARGGGVAGGFLGEKSFAAEAAGKDAGQGVEEAKGVHRIFVECAADGFGAEIDKHFTKE